MFKVIASVQEGSISLLGIVLILALLCGAGYLMVTVNDEVSRKKRNREARERMKELERRRREAEKLATEREARKMQKESELFRKETIEYARKRFSDLVVEAGAALPKIASAYAKIARNLTKEPEEVLSNQFQQASGAQWRFLKNDLGHAGYTEIEPQLRLIFSIRNMRAGADSGLPANLKDRELASSKERLELARQLMDSAFIERMGSFQMDTAEAIRPMKRCYDRSIKDWLADTLFKIVAKIRERDGNGNPILDEDMKGGYVRLKCTLELIAKLVDQLEANLQSVRDEETAFAQILYGSAIIGIISELPEWCPELSSLPRMGENVEVEARMETAAQSF